MGKASCSLLPRASSQALGDGGGWRWARSPRSPRADAHGRSCPVQGPRGPYPPSASPWCPTKQRNPPPPSSGEAPPKATAVGDAWRAGPKGWPKDFPSPPSRCEMPMVLLWKLSPGENRVGPGKDPVSLGEDQVRPGKDWVTPGEDQQSPSSAPVWSKLPASCTDHGTAHPDPFLPCKRGDASRSPLPKVRPLPAEQSPPLPPRRPR